jgi:hypothetical protein
MIRQTLTTWELAGAHDLTDDIVLAASEVLSNAVLYGLARILGNRWARTPEVTRASRSSG